jgi:methyl-accepting chemotaxis protein
VQQNAAAVQESASAAAGMREQADSLVQAVSAFKVEDGANLPTRATPGKPGSDLARAAGKAARSIAGKSGPVPKLAAATAIAGDDWEEF